MSYRKVTKQCACGCRQSFIGHPNKRFLNSEHKDRYHNANDPRRQRYQDEQGRWGSDYEDDILGAP